jgi:hypothetical protein
VVENSPRKDQVIMLGGQCRESSSSGVTYDCLATVNSSKTLLVTCWANPYTQRPFPHPASNTLCRGTSPV